MNEYIHIRIICNSNKKNKNHFCTTQMCCAYFRFGAPETTCFVSGENGDSWPGRRNTRTTRSCVAISGRPRTDTAVRTRARARARTFVNIQWRVVVWTNFPEQQSLGIREGPARHSRVARYVCLGSETIFHVLKRPRRTAD